MTLLSDNIYRLHVSQRIGFAPVLTFRHSKFVYLFQFLCLFPKMCSRMSNAKGFYHARAVHYPVFGNYNESSIQEGLSLNFSVANICER